MLEKIKENLEILLDQDKAEKIFAALGKFKEDAWVVAVFNTKLESVITNDNEAFQSMEQLITFSEQMILQDYGTMNPLMLSNLYRQGFERNSLKLFGSEAKHLKRVFEIAPGILTASLVINADYQAQPFIADHYRENQRIYNHPFNIKDRSYLSIMNMLISNQQYQEVANQVLDSLEGHFADLRKNGIDADKLVERGYGQMLYQLFSVRLGQAQNPEAIDNFKKGLDYAGKTLSNLKGKGIMIYHESAVDLLTRYSNERKLQDLEKLTSYAGKNFMLLNLKVYLDGKQPA